MKNKPLCNLLLLKNHHTEKIMNVMRISIFLLFLCVSVAFTQNTVVGVVTDNFGDPIIGANMIEKGTTNGTITDFDGNYSITVPQGATLQVSYIGYLTKEVTVGTQKVINITLVEDSQALDEVVVVGYGTMKKSDVTGSISVTDAKDILKQQSFSALDGLKGKAAGVNIYTNSGQPGGKNRVTIRGIGTINSKSDPLYVVDGVVMEDFKYLNPNDIERIEVLKDASSAAIYGARGANGVIMVTTKRGLKGEGTSITYDGSVSVSQVARYMDVMNAAEWMKAFSQAIDNHNKWFAASEADKRSTDLSTYFNDSRLFRPDGTPIYDTDWQREATRTAISHNHQINIQQGGPNSSVGAFLNFTDQQGIMLNSYLKRLNAKLAYDAKPTKYLSTAINLLVNHTWGNVAEETGGHQMPRRTMIEMVPWLPVKLDEEWTNSDTGGQGLEGMANPVHVLETQQRMEYKTQIFRNAAFTFHLAKGLDLKTQFGIDSYLNRNRYYSPTDLKNISFPDGEANFYNYDTYYWQEETYLTYHTTIGKHRINAMAGLSWQERVYRRNRSRADGFADDFSGYDNMGAGTVLQKPESEYQRWAMNSYFVRGAYTYNDKYSATLTARIDGSSKFGDNNKYSFFPSAGLAWITSSEGFMEDLTAIDQLKFHTSYGVTGNSEFDVYKSLANVKSGTVLINGSLESGSYTERLANPDLKWERTGMWDIGFNLNMFGNRLNFDVSYYYKLTKDLLLDRPVPYSTGYKSVIDNIGQVKNTGMDFMINTINMDTKDFGWSSSLNFNYNKNIIMKLGENDEDILMAPSFISGENTILRVGESLGTFWGYKNYGVWTEAEAEQAKAAGYSVGQAKISDEKMIIGNALPDITGSFINNLRYKNFDFTLDLQFVLGSEILQQYLHSTEDRFGKANGLATILDGYNGSNPGTMIQAIRNDGYFPDGHWSDVNSHWVANGSYLRANLIQLGYTFDQSVLDKLKIAALRVNFSVNNAFLICSKDFKGYDPEGTSNDDHNGQNIFFFQYPKPRTYTLGLNVTF